MEKQHYVYIVRCADDTLYTGWTTDIKRRIAVHNAGKGAKYTRNRHPVHLEYIETYNEKGQALSREAQIKKLSRLQKLALIKTGEVKSHDI